VTRKSSDTDLEMMSAVKEAINECLQGVNTPRTTKAKIEEVVNMGDGGGGGGGGGGKDTGTGRLHLLRLRGVAGCWI